MPDPAAPAAAPPERVPEPGRTDPAPAASGPAEPQAGADDADLPDAAEELGDFA